MPVLCWQVSRVRNTSLPRSERLDSSPTERVPSGHRDAVYCRGGRCSGPGSSPLRDCAAAETVRQDHSGYCGDSTRHNALDFSGVPVRPYQLDGARDHPAAREAGGGGVPLGALPQGLRGGRHCSMEVQDAGARDECSEHGAVLQVCDEELSTPQGVWNPTPSFCACPRAFHGSCATRCSVSHSHCFTRRLRSRRSRRCCCWWVPSSQSGIRRRARGR